MVYAIAAMTLRVAQWCMLTTWLVLESYFTWPLDFLVKLGPAYGQHMAKSFLVVVQPYEKEATLLFKDLGVIVALLVGTRTIQVLGRVDD